MSRFPVVVVGMLALSLAACDTTDTFRPFLPTDQTLGLYGFLDATTSEQVVRVEPLRASVDLPTTPEAARLDVVVGSRNLLTGDSLVWVQQVVLLRDGSYAATFRARFQPEPGTSYRITARRRDGTAATARVTVPAGTQATPSSWSEDGGGVFAAYTWPGLQRLDSVLVRYQVWHQGITGRTTIYTLSYPRSNVGYATDAGWQLDVALTHDLARIRALANLTPLDEVVLYDVGLVAYQASPDWFTPDGLFDPEVLARPEAFTNVTGGYGFVGALMVSESYARPPGAAIQAAGFVAGTP